MDQDVYWVWLSLRCSVGSDTYAALRRHFPDPRAVYEAGSDALAEAIGQSDKDLRRLCDKATDDAERVLQYCRLKHIGILTYDDPLFPPMLRALHNPPVLLYYRGTLPDFSLRLLVAVVGTREATSYGQRQAFEIAQDLSRAGAIVVSGLAYGIDAVAGAAAVGNGYATVAVLGTGIETIYPKEHRLLAEEIARQGLLISEFPPGAQPDGSHFPLRNRIISGLSAATLVIEGTAESGAMITARLAEEQGHAVYALPGNVDSGMSEGPFLLLKNGARMATCADDIIRDFEGQYPDSLSMLRLLHPVHCRMEAVLRRLSVVSFRKKRKKK